MLKPIADTAQGKHDMYKGRFSVDGQHLLRHLVVSVCFALVAFLMFYQPLFNLSTHVPGTAHSDYFHFHWNYWWIDHVLNSPDLTSIYQSDYIMFPAVNNLAYHTLTPFWFPVWAAFTPIVGTIGAVNLMLFIGLWLSGWLAFWFLHNQGIGAAWSLTGALMFQATPFVIHAVHMSWVSMVGWFWLPGLLLLWGKVAHKRADSRRRMMWAIITGIGLWGMALTDMQYVLFLMPLMLPYVLWTLAQVDGAPRRLQIVGAGVLSVVVGVALLWMAGPLSYIADFQQNASTATDAELVFALDFPRAFFGGSQNYFDILPAQSIGSLLMPLLLGCTAIGIIWRRRLSANSSRCWFWLAVAIVPLVLSIGATLHVFGLKIPLPYRLLHDLLGNVFRFPLRFSMTFTLAIVIFIGLTLTPLASGHKRLWLAVLLILLVCVDMRLLRPQYIQLPLPDYHFYHEIGAKRGAGYDELVIVDVPTAAGSGEVWVGDPRAIYLQYHGVTHGKRMVNGHVSRVPAEHFWHLRTDDAMLSWLGQRRYLEPEAVAEQLRQRITDWPLGYIVVHQDLIGRETTTITEIIGYLNAQHDLLCPVFVEGDAVVYRTAAHPLPCPPRTPSIDSDGAYYIDIGADDDLPYIGWGWHWQEQVSGLPVRWTGDQTELIAGQTWEQADLPQATLYVELPVDDYTLTITVQSFEQDRTLSVTINEQVIASRIVSADGLAPLVFSVPSDALRINAPNQIDLIYDAPAESTERSLALMVADVRFMADGD